MLLVGDILRRTATRFPNKTGIVCGTTRWSWWKANEEANRLANALQDKGIGHGDRVAVMMENCHRCLVAYFALAKVGAIDVPVNTRFVEREILHINNVVGARAFVFNQAFAGKIESVRQQMGTVGNYIAVGDDLPQWADSYEALVSSASPQEPKAVLDENDPVAILFTGGTTAAPKGATFTHRAHCIWSANVIVDLDFDEDDVTLHTAPFFHVGALISNMLTITNVGGTNVILEKFDARRLLETIAGERITHFFGAPTMFISLMELPEFSRYDISSLKKCLYSSAPMHAEVLKRVLDTFPGVQFYQVYGLTEGGFATVLKPKDQARKPNTVGHFSFNVDVRIVDQQGRDVAPGQVGEVIIRSEAAMKEYYNNPEQTAETLRDGWVYTGDLATIDHEGYLSIVDRAKDMIKSGGEQIAAREVEEVLYKHPAIREVAVIGIPDDKWGEAVHAVVALRRGELAMEDELIEHCKKYLASYKKPKSVEFVDELPKVSEGGGKIRKRELRERYWAHLGRKI